MATGFFWDERTFWHGGGNYAFTLPLGGFVQPLAAGGLPESPETKRRLKNLMDVSGITADLAMQSADHASFEDLMRVHPESYLKEFKEMSDNGGGELGARTPFAQGGYEHCTLSAGLAKQAVASVLDGTLENAYALSRPPGHHCLPDFPNGFCLLANIAIALEAARAKQPGLKAVVLDWDVHHGNGTEAIYFDRDDTLTISLHQEGNYPLDSGQIDVRGTGAGEGYNLNLPMHAGSGQTAYMHAMERIVRPAIEAFKPDLIVVACGFDAAVPDPLSTMLATAQTFHDMTAFVKGLARELCDGKLVLVHEGGYSEVYVPFCGHATLEALSGSKVHVPDPLEKNFTCRQPGAPFDAFLRSEIDRMAGELGL